MFSVRCKPKTFKLFGSHGKNDANCTCKMKSRIAMAKAAFNRKKVFSPADWT
jgi:hypothetical protein